jgi:hypothetical protein
VLARIDLDGRAVELLGERLSIERDLHDAHVFAPRAFRLEHDRRQLARELVEPLAALVLDDARTRRRATSAECIARAVGG